MSMARKYAAKVLHRVHGTFRKIAEQLNPSIHNQVVSLKPDGSVRGHVLLSYRIEGFLQEPAKQGKLYHPSWVRTERMAKILLCLGYAVDVIANQNKHFRPQKEYTMFIDTRMNFERLAPILNKNCVKILFVTTAHPYFQNAAEAKRLMNLQERRHVTLRSRRFMPPDYAMAVEYADCLMVSPEEFLLQNFRYANKPFYLVPTPAEHVYPWAETKNFESCRNRFLWLGSRGLVHKGLDLVLEAFAETPEYHLTICGPLGKEKEFTRAYREMLYELPNIHTEGWVDVSSSRFVEISKRCIALIYPSCSESGGGSVINCMHAGLIPIVSREASVDIDGFGFILKDCSIEAIKQAVQIVAGLPSEELEARARRSWDYARTHHTREIFAREYRKAIAEIFTRLDTKEASLERTAISRSFAQPSSQPLES